MQSDATPLRNPTVTARSWLHDTALGMVSTTSFPAIIGTADAMMKSANVFLVGYEKTGGGHCTVIVRGGVADVRMAVHAGEKTAQQFGQFISSSMIPRPMANGGGFTHHRPARRSRRCGPVNGRQRYWPIRDPRLSGDGRCR